MTRAVYNDMTENRDKVCVEILERALEKPITTPKQSFYVLERLATCFVAVARDVNSLTNEVYGNGVPGGLKAEIREMRADIARLLSERDKEEGIKEDMTDNSEKNDWFRAVVGWFVDKILPTIVIVALSALCTIVTWAIMNGALGPISK